MNGESWTFFRAFLRAPLVVASVTPSSSFLTSRVIAAAEPASAEVVVELGPGTGGITRSLLAAMGPEGRLIAIERTPEFVEGLGRIGDRRLSVVNACASSIGEELARRGLKAADAVVSGIPFSTLPAPLAEDIVRAVFAALGPGGRFVAYQVSDRVAEYARPVMGEPTVEFELRNVPPTRVFTWRSRHASGDGADRVAGKLDGVTRTPPA